MKNYTIGRRFLITLLSLILFTLFSFAGEVKPPYSKKALLAELVKLNDQDIPGAISRQWTHPTDTYYGAVFDGDSVVSPIGTAQLIQNLMCSYVSPDSKYFKSKDILDHLTLAAKGLLNLQHEDGTVDLLSANFHSTPDLGFTIYPLSLAWSIMGKNEKLNYGEFPAIMKQYLFKAGKALTVGGIHTPNHRWVVSGALAWLDTFFPNPEYRARIEQWLAEKIDIDPDGQYNERSTAGYTSTIYSKTSAKT